MIPSSFFLPFLQDSQMQLLEMRGELHQRHTCQVAEAVHRPFPRRREITPHHHRSPPSQSALSVLRMLQGRLKPPGPLPTPACPSSSSRLPMNKYVYLYCL